MNRDFYTFLSKLIDPVCAGEWINTSVEKVEVYPDKGLWRLYVALSEPLSLNTLEKTAEQLRDALQFPDNLEIIPVTYNVAQNLNSILDLHKDDLSSSFFSGKNEKFNAFQWRINEDRLDLITGSKKSYNYIIENEICTHIASWFWEKYCLRVLVRVLCSQDNAAVSVQDDFIIQGPVEVLEISPWPVWNLLRFQMSRKECGIL